MGRIVCYGVANYNNEHIDVSLTERGAKNFATRNGFTIVTVRNGYFSSWVAEKVNGKWLPIEHMKYKEAKEAGYKHRRGMLLYPVAKGKHNWSQTAKEEYEWCN